MSPSVSQLFHALKSYYNQNSVTEFNTKSRKHKSYFKTANYTQMYEHPTAVFGTSKVEFIP